MIALFFDTETNGIKTWQNPNFKLKLVQMGAILQDTDTKRVYGEINLINGDVGDIPREASRVHGITSEVATMVGIPKTLIDESFAALVRTADVLVAHNLDYDLSVLEDYMPESWQAVQGKKQFCTMKENIMTVKAPLTGAQQTYFARTGVKPDYPYKVPSLAQTYQFYFKEMFSGAHDAMADIRACRDIYFKMGVNQ
jgi:DNA polymerase-3 subunit epsilon